MHGGVIGPKGDFAAQWTHFTDTVTPADMIVQIAGIVLYDDVFGGRHRTEYCYVSSIPPINSLPDGRPIKFTPIFCPKHNCTDDECAASG